MRRTLDDDTLTKLADDLDAGAEIVDSDGSLAATLRAMVMIRKEFGQLYTAVMLADMHISFTPEGITVSPALEDYNAD